MRRASALLLAVVGYAGMATLPPETATLPAAVAFAAMTLVLLRPDPRPRDEAERVASELLRSRW
jgi:putative Ca2+/H+ antiporter (TMEM165/GDT1 family)